MAKSKSTTGTKKRASTAKRKVVATPDATKDDVVMEDAKAGGSVVVKPPPSVNVPTPPDGWVAPPFASYRTTQPKAAMLGLIPAVATELRGFTNYAQTFGATAPSASDVATSLTTAAAWSSTSKATNTWSDYVRPNEGLAWKAALPLIDSLKAAFALAVAAKPSLADQYPTLTMFLGVSKLVAKRAVATRKLNKANGAALAAAKAENTALQASATPVANPTPPVTPSTAPNAAVVVMAAKS